MVNNIYPGLILLTKVDKLMSIEIEEGWRAHLDHEFNSEYMINLRHFLKGELSKNKTIYPHGSEIFSAFNSTNFDKVKVVIIGQDPYHGPGQAHGMCFSVKKGVRIPPSLVNIYKELQADLQIAPASHGHLMDWADQGVFLLNAVLTVEKAKAASHQGKGWEQFTDKVIEVLNEQKENLVFLLWGSPAQKKAAKVDTKKHLVLKAPHPSPLAAYRGFFGCKHFSKANAYLKSKKIEQIDWTIRS